MNCKYTPLILWTLNTNVGRCLPVHKMKPKDMYYLDGFLVNLNLPDVIQSKVHWASIVELLLKLHCLSCHLNADKHMQQGLRQVRHQRVCRECLFSCIPKQENELVI